MNWAVVLSAGLVAAVLPAVRFPRYGIGVLVFFGPFFTILHEIAPEGPLFFVWPYLLVGLLMLGFVSDSLYSRLISEEGKGREWFRWGLLSALALYVLFVAAAGGLLNVMVSQKGLRSLGDVFSNTVLFSLFLPIWLVLLAFIWFSVRELRMRESSLRFLDLAIVAFVLWGLVEMGITYYHSGFLFTGLEGYRRYFFMAFVYLVARCFIRTQKQAQLQVCLFLVAALLGSAQMLGEMYLLNSAAVPPQNIPWMGFLSKSFGYTYQVDRKFLDTTYVPLGFMFMTHISGLYLLLGIAYALPRAVGILEWKRSAGWLFFIFALMYGMIWTSRTSLILLTASLLLTVALFLGRVSWTRVVIVLVTIPLSAALLSYKMLPGSRYDLISDFSYATVGQGIPNLFSAVHRDWFNVFGGVSLEVRRETVPLLIFGEKWSVNRNVVIRKGKKADGESVIDAIWFSPPDKIDSELRYEINVPRKYRGAEIGIAVRLMADTKRQVRLMIHDTVQARFSKFHSGNGKFETLNASMVIDSSARSVTFDIDLGARGGKIGIQNVLLTLAGQRIFVLDRDKSVLSAEKNLKKEKKKGKIGEVSRIAWQHFLWGKGVSFTGWSRLLYAGKMDGRRLYAHASYSDLNYLEFFQQFGLIGLILLLLLPVGMLQEGIRTWRYSKRDNSHRCLVMGFMLMGFVGFGSLIHLPSMFRAGFNSQVFLAMALLVLYGNIYRGMSEPYRAGQSG